MADKPAPKSPEWWLDRLRKALADECKGREWERTKELAGGAKGKPGLDLLGRYIDGEPPLTRVSAGWRDSLRPYIRMARLNVAELVVGGAADRMVPIGWTTALENDLDGDSKAAEIAAANHLDIVGADMARNMLTFRRGYLMLSQPRHDKIPTITSEDPRHMMVATDPRTGAAVAAVKVGRDEWTDTEMAWLYLPGRVHEARQKGKRRGTLELGESQRLPKGFESSIPIFPAVNFDGVGEFERHLDTLDRINDGIFERIVIAKYQAFRQRAVKNLPNTDPDTGEEIDYRDVFTADPGALWQLPPEAEMWESAATDLGPVRMAVKDDLEHLAAVTRTPLHMVSPDAASGSAEGASTMREANTFRVRDRRRRANVALSECVSACLRSIGDDERAQLHAIRTLWEPIEIVSTTGRAAAMRDATQGGVPFEAAAIDFGGYEPSDLPRLRGARATDLLFQAPVMPNGSA